MSDLDDVLRADAARWRATQPSDPDLDLALETVVRRTRTPRRARLALVAAAVAVVAATGGIVAVANRVDDRGTHGAAAGPTSSVRASRSSSPRPASTTPARLSGLGVPPAGQRTLLAATGRGNRTWTIAPAVGRGELYVACTGGGTITVDMPASGGFDVDCTGMASGASMPSLGRVVRISGVTDQTWRIAVFGR